MKNSKNLLITFALATTGALSSFGVVTFDGQPDNAVIGTTTQFTDNGVTFEMYIVNDFNVNGPNGTRSTLYYEQTGQQSGDTTGGGGFFTNVGPGTGTWDNDNSGPATSLGTSFVRTDTANAFGLNTLATRALIIRYVSGLPFAASGEIWDIDIQPSNGFEEGFVARAFNSSGTLLDTDSFVASDFSRDSRPWIFGLESAGDPISYIALTWHPDARRTSGVGLAFNNFDATTVPEPTTYAAILGIIGLGLVIRRRRSVK